MLHQFIVLFVTQTFLSYSCNETTGSRNQGTGKAYLLLDFFLQYCSPLKLDLRIFQELCLTAVFIQ